MAEPSSTPVSTDAGFLPPLRMGRPRHFCLPRQLEAQVEAEAEARGVSSLCLVSAILQTVIAENLVDAVFDGRSPEQQSPGLGVNADGLTRIQAGLVYLVALHGDIDGRVHMTGKELAYLIDPDGGVSASGVFTCRDRLCQLGLLALEKHRVGRSRTMRLTEKGWQIARQFTGDDFRQGGRA